MAKHENLDLSRFLFFSKIKRIRVKKKTFKKVFSILLPHPELETYEL